MNPIQIDFGDNLSDAEIQDAREHFIRLGYRVDSSSRSLTVSHPNADVMARLRMFLEESGLIPAGS